jgi:bifunctional non-homologous end joining protein LigD
LSSVLETAAPLDDRRMRATGEDRRQRPIEERPDRLSRLVADGALFSEALTGEGEFAKACEIGLEGIVSKRAGSRYWSGKAGSG